MKYGCNDNIKVGGIFPGCGDLNKISFFGILKDTNEVIGKKHYHRSDVKKSSNQDRRLGALVTFFLVSIIY